MKRKTAAKRINTHLDDYEKRLAEDEGVWLDSYELRTGRDCPLCEASPSHKNDLQGHGCINCIKWPTGQGCDHFMERINDPTTRRTKLRWIAKLRVALDEWVKEEAPK